MNYRKRKTTKSKKLQWYENINSYPNLYGLGIEQHIMDALAKEMTKEIDKAIIEAMRGEHNAFNSMSPVKDGIK